MRGKGKLCFFEAPYGSELARLRLAYGSENFCASWKIREFYSAHFFLVYQ